MRASERNTELLQSVFNRDLDAVKKFINEGADVNVVGGRMLRLFAGETPLWMAVRYAGDEISQERREFSQAISALDPTIPIRNFDEKRKQAFAIVKLLIEAGADIEKPCFGSTPLYRAVHCRDAEMVRHLLSKNANPNAETFSIMSKLSQRQGRKTVPGYLHTVLHEAVEKEQPEIVKALVSAGANVKRLDHEGKSPSDIATAKGLTQILQILNEGQ